MQPSTISERTALMLVGAFAGALMFAGLVIAYVSEAQHRTMLLETVTVDARILGDTASAALSFGDEAAARQYVMALRDDPETEAAALYDERGRRLGSFGQVPARLGPGGARSEQFRGGRAIAVEPVMQKGMRVGTVYMRTRDEPLERQLSRYSGVALLVIMASLMFLALGVYARALTQANLDLKAQMAERERVEAALRHSQKMEAVGRLTGGIAHDFNNMLAIVIGSLDVLRRRLAGSDPKTLRLAESAAEGARRAADVTQRLLAFSRMQPLNPKPVDIGQAVADLSTLLTRTLGETIDVQVVVANGLWLAFVDQAQFESAILNLAINSRDAMPNGGKLTIECSNAYLDRAHAAQGDGVSPGLYVLVTVTDTGTGIPPDQLGQVFEPFFTTKPSGVGTGLGLSQVHGFIRQSGGHVVIYSEVGVGTSVKLFLPRSTVIAAVEPPPPRGVRERDRRGVTVLIVEDEAGVREFATEAVGELGFDTLVASDAKTALELLETHPGVKIILTDVIMADIKGPDLVAQAQQRRPGLGVIYMTGYTRNALLRNGVLNPGTHLLSKPFTVEQLSRELDAAVLRAEAAEERRGPPAGDEEPPPRLH
jgi:signal transduction histidine kinase/CheY-like chemotaxis protein